MKEPKFSVGDRAFSVCDKVFTTVVGRQYFDREVLIEHDSSIEHYRGWGYLLSHMRSDLYEKEKYLRPIPKEQPTEWDETIWHPNRMKQPEKAP